MVKLIFKLLKRSFPRFELMTSRTQTDAQWSVHLPSSPTIKVWLHWHHFFKLCQKQRIYKSISFSDVWIRTSDVWCRKRPLYQLSHNHCLTLHFLTKVMTNLTCSMLVRKVVVIFISETQSRMSLDFTSHVECWLCARAASKGRRHTMLRESFLKVTILHFTIMLNFPSNFSSILHSLSVVCTYVHMNQYMYAHTHACIYICMNLSCMIVSKIHVYLKILHM